MNPMKPSAPPGFQFRYRRQTASRPDTETEETIAYPMLPCAFEWRGRRTPQVEGLLDSGSDGLVIPLGIAEFLGLELRDEEKPMQVVSHEVPRFSALVDFIIGRGGRLFTFRNVTAHIPREGDVPILIGRDPVFKAYKVTFDDSNLTFHLVPNG